MQHHILALTAAKCTGSQHAQKTTTQWWLAPPSDHLISLSPCGGPCPCNASPAAVYASSKAPRLGLHHQDPRTDRRQVTGVLTMCACSAPSAGKSVPASPGAVPAPKDPSVKASASMAGSGARPAMDARGDNKAQPSPATLDAFLHHVGRHDGGATGPNRPLPSARDTPTARTSPHPARRGSSGSEPSSTAGSSPELDMDGSTVVDPDEEGLSDPGGDDEVERQKRQAAKSGKAVWTRYCDVQPLTRPAAATAPAPEKPSTGDGDGGGGGYYDAEPDEKARRDWEAAQEREMERWALGNMIDCGWED
ncbi:hypothetical protein GGTG_05987 [Gaeumannomyces tritici R3-111a-1]|uniref:Uncharacterized protein n=1 Tax=Gaeumannomyces tritici (strain R3-111a-1) TaxID=644352 RepID=J3NXI1_GAET3|nr:hypothetical protein GGTG_05987 [Gaeumannomyces tritici R3-111a-1]EJT76063.1 hypothetical protein GGTG_05987 [Gaeumannomyces tritici R3-111a-1]